MKLRKTVLSGLAGFILAAMLNLSAAQTQYQPEKQSDNSAALSQDASFNAMLHEPESPSQTIGRGEGYDADSNTKSSAMDPSLLTDDMDLPPQPPDNTSSFGGEKIDPKTIPPPKEQMAFLLDEMEKNKIKYIYYLSYDNGFWTIKTLTPINKPEKVSLSLNDRDNAKPTPGIAHIFKCNLAKKQCAQIGTEKVTNQQIPPDMASLRNALRFVSEDNPNAIFRSVEFKDGNWVIDAMIRYGMAMRKGQYVVDPTGTDMIRAADSSDA